jgi:nucleolar protein 12
MSLFGGIFQSSGISAGLFSDASKYKAHSSSGPLVEQPPQQADTQQPKKKRKHDLAGDAGLADCHAGIAPAQTAGKAAAPTSKNLKQATAADGTAISQQVHKKAKKQHAVPQSTTQSPGQAAVQQQEQQEQHPQLQENNKKLKKQKRQGQLDKQHKGNADEAVGGLHKTTSGIKGKPRPPATAAAAAAAVAAASAATPPSHVGKESSDDYTTIATTGVAESAKQQQQQQQQQQHDEDPAVAAEKLTRTIFVGNLPVTVKAKTLRRRFAEYGSVDSVRLRSVPLDLESKKKLPRKAAVIKGSVGTDRGGAKAYVVFEDASAAEAALAANMTEVRCCCTLCGAWQSSSSLVSLPGPLTDAGQVHVPCLLECKLFNRCHELCNELPCWCCL